MDPIEESVRRALEGGDPANHAFRRSIYAASYRAMERMIASRGSDAQAAEEERARVAEVIERVESEYAGYYGSEDGAPEAGEPPHGSPSAHDFQEPAASGAPVDEGRAPSSFAAPPAGAARPSAEGEVWRPGATTRADTRRRPGRSVLLALGLVLLLALLLVAGTFLFGTDKAQTPGPAAEGAAPTQTAAATDTPSWIAVFAGSNIEQVSTPGGSRVASVDEAGRSAIRISSPQGGEGEVMINLGPGLVQRIAGSEVRVEIVAGSPDGGERQFSVRCMFGEASVCERQSFVTAMPEEAFVFDVAIPGGADTPANLAIGPSLTEGGPDLDVYSVRMRVL